MMSAAVFAAVANAAGIAPVYADQSYTVAIEGAENGLRAKLELLSDLKKGLRDYPTAAALRRAARRDVVAFNEALQAAGYYAGKASFQLSPGTPGEKAAVLFTIDTGPVFKVVDYEILYHDDFPDRPLTLAAAKITPDGSAAGADLHAVQQSFLNYLRESGYPEAEIVARRAIADMDAGTAHAVFVFNSGEKARFGDIEIEGLVKTRPNYLRKLKTWTPDADYDRSKIVAYRDRLAKTNLFSTINVSPGPVDNNGRSPVIVNVEERKRRTIGVGASFSTSEGPGGRLYFENRNIFRRGENLRVEITGSELEQAVSFDVVKPLPGLPGSAFGNFKLANETTDAYHARSLSLASGLAKKWLKDRLETRAALALETSKIDGDGMDKRTYFVSTPMSVLWNTENSLLNPTKGARVSAVVTPYTGSENFVQAEFGGRSRVNIGKNDRFTLAARVGLGATFGVSLTICRSISVCSPAAAVRCAAMAIRRPAPSTPTAIQPGGAP